jgi:hypothetical protein
MYRQFLAYAAPWQEIPDGLHSTPSARPSEQAGAYSSVASLRRAPVNEEPSGLVGQALERSAARRI